MTGWSDVASPQTRHVSEPSPHGVRTSWLRESTASRVAWGVVSGMGAGVLDWNERCGRASTGAGRSLGSRLEDSADPWPPLSQFAHGAKVIPGVFPKKKGAGSILDPTP